MSEPQTTYAERRPLDLYTTERPITEALLERVFIRGIVYEPCVGPGHMARVLEEQEHISEVITNDVDRQWPAAYHGDAGEPTAKIWTHWTRPDWVVTNPPFSEAYQILPLSLYHARVGVAFLLRLTYMEPANGRGDWLQQWADKQKYQIVFNPRPSFTHDGKTDSVTCAWFVWEKGWSWRGAGIGCPFQFVTGWR